MIDTNREIENGIFKSAVENASDHIIITDENGGILYANKATTKITGYSQEEIIGTKAGKLWGGLMPKDFYTKMWKTIKTEKKFFWGELKIKEKMVIFIQPKLT